MSERRDQIHPATRKCLTKKRSPGRWPGPTVGPGADDGSLFLVRADVICYPRRRRLSTSRRNAVTRNITSPASTEATSCPSMRNSVPIRYRVRGCPGSPRLRELPRAQGHHRPTAATHQGRGRRDRTGDCRAERRADLWLVPLDRPAARGGTWQTTTRAVAGKSPAAATASCGTAAPINIRSFSSAGTASTLPFHGSGAATVKRYFTAACYLARRLAPWAPPPASSHWGRVSAQAARRRNSCWWPVPSPTWTSIRPGAGGTGRRGRGIACLGWGGAVVAGRAGRLLAGVLVVAFWGGGGPAGQKPERVFGWGTGLGGVEGQHEPGLGGEVHRGVGNFDDADDRVAEALVPGVVQLDVVRGPAGAELRAGGGEFTDEGGQVAVQRVAAGFGAQQCDRGVRDVVPVGVELMRARVQETEPGQVRRPGRVRVERCVQGVGEGVGGQQV